MEKTPLQTDESVCRKSFASRFYSEGLLFELVFICLVFFFFFSIMNKWIFAGVTGPSGQEWATGKVAADGQVQVGHINLLVMGVDSVDGTYRADTIFVMGINPAKARVTMMSIPRDTRVVINGRSRKINEILPRYGESVLRSLIEDLLNIEISRYVQVDFKGFINIIDLLGGIDINIDRAMNYDDFYGKVHIHFKAGPNRLTGQEALNYVRFRADALADLGRIKRQQKFVRVLVEKLSQPASVVRFPQIMAQTYDHVKTDISLAEIYTIFKGFKNFKIKFQNSSLPGEARYIDKISYYLPFRDKALELGGSYFSDFAALELVASFTSIIASETINEN